MPDRPPLIDVANSRGAARTGGPIPPSPEILEEVAALRGSAAEGEVLTYKDGRPVWLPADSVAGGSVLFGQAVAQPGASGGYRIRAAGHVLRVTLSCESAPVGAPLTVEVRVDGAVIATCTVPDGETGPAAVALDVAVAAGARLNVNATSAGDTPAEGVVVQVDLGA